MRILVCPLNWGLGHATRCIPIINQLINDGHDVVIAADGYPLVLLKNRFPSLNYVILPSYQIKYSGGKSQFFAMIQNLPNIFQGIWKEHKWLKNTLAHEHFDKIISDNRFGLWHSEVHCIYITHQIMVKMPNAIKWLEPIVYKIHKKIINQYNECWIPDSEYGDTLSGDLSHKYAPPSNAKYIGFLSRFKEMNHVLPDNYYSVIAILSGVEPQRSLFELEIINIFKNSQKKVLIVQGLPQAVQKQSKINNIRLVSHINDATLATLIKGTEKIIIRSGYSSIMDLKVLNCLEKAELIPTPGQTEQEYLAMHLKQNNY